MFQTFRGAESLADGFLFSLACARAGVPVLLVGPQDSGKTTIIYAVKEWLDRNKIPNREVSRIGLKTLREIASELHRQKYMVILNEDYSNIGDSDYMTEKMGQIIATLSYSKGYYDYGLGVSIKVKKLGFVSGVQPIWIKDIMEKRVFSTNIREKFIRYYLLPHKPSEYITMEDAIKLLNENQKTYKQQGDVNVPPQFVDALARQVGRTRAIEFTEKIVEELKNLYPIYRITKLLRFFTTRISFEQNLVEREITEKGYKVYVYWKGYTVLYWCLRHGERTREDFLEHLGVSSLRSVDRSIDEAFTKGWINITPTRNTRYIPNYNIFKMGGGDG